MRGGRPRVRGMSITVYGVLGYLASGVLQEEIPSDFPYPEAEVTLDGPAFAADFVRRVVAEPSL